MSDLAADIFSHELKQLINATPHIVSAPLRTLAIQLTFTIIKIHLIGLASLQLRHTRSFTRG